MAFVATYDGTNLDDGTTYKVRDTRFGAAPIQTAEYEYGSRPGGVVALTRSGIRSATVDGVILGASLSAVEANRDALLKVLRRPRKRLILSAQDSRFYVATLRRFDVNERLTQRGMLYTAEFAVETPYAQNPTPSADVRTPTLALQPAQTTQYSLTYSLTPGGNVPTPMRIVAVNQAGGVTPTRWMVSNLTADPAQRATSTATVAAADLIVFDGSAQKVYTSDGAALVGYWPCQDAASTVKDFSGNDRNLTAGGSGNLYNQDSPFYSALSSAGSGYWQSTDAAFALVANISASAWVSPSQVAARAGILGKTSAGTNHLGYGMQVTSAGLLEAWVSDSATTRTATGTTALVAGRWYHCAMVWDDTANTVSCYLNGRLEAQTAGGAYTVAAGDQALLVGAATNNLQSFANWQGSITEVGVLNVALTAAQVLAITRGGYVTDYNASRAAWVGNIPDLDPTLGTTNSFEFRCDHATTLPTPRVAAMWRPWWD